MKRYGSRRGDNDYGNDDRPVHGGKSSRARAKREVDVFMAPTRPRDAARWRNETGSGEEIAECADVVLYFPEDPDARFAVVRSLISALLDPSNDMITLRSRLVSISDVSRWRRAKP